MPSRSWNSSKRVTPRKASRRMSGVHHSPMISSDLGDAAVHVGEGDSAHVTHATDLSCVMKLCSATVRCMKQPTAVEAVVTTDPVDGVRGHRGRRVHGRPRPVDRERGLPVDQASFPDVVDGDAVVGAVVVQRRVRRAAARCRPRRRPLGPEALVPPRSADVHGRLGGLRRRPGGVAADRRPGRPGASAPRC